MNVKLKEKDAETQVSLSHGKVVDWVEHKFEEGILFIDVQFVDKTALPWSIGATIVIKEAHVADWKTGD